MLEEQFHSVQIVPLGKQWLAVMEDQRATVLGVSRDLNLSIKSGDLVVHIIEY